MKTVNTIAAQGDMVILDCEALNLGGVPDDARKVTPESGKYVVTHSETGHHHTVMERDVQMYEAADNEFVAWLKCINDTVIEHNRSFDTHESAGLKAGRTYRINRQQEFMPDGWRKPID